MLQYNSKHLIARIISTLFVPPSFPLILFPLFAFKYESDPHKILLSILVTITFSFSFPIILFVILRRQGKIADSDATIKEERTFPFIISALFYALGLIILIKAQVNIISIAFWFCYITNTVFIIIINEYWKISAHMLGAAGPFAAVCFVYGLNALPFILLLCVIGWARIFLKCHNIYQVLAGGLLGFTSTILQMEIITRNF